MYLFLPSLYYHDYYYYCYYNYNYNYHCHYLPLLLTLGNGTTTQVVILCRVKSPFEAPAGSFQTSLGSFNAVAGLLLSFFGVLLVVETGTGRRSMWGVSVFPQRYEQRRWRSFPGNAVHASQSEVAPSLRVWHVFGIEGFGAILGGCMQKKREISFSRAFSQTRPVHGIWSACCAARTLGKMRCGWPLAVPAGSFGSGSSRGCRRLTVCGDGHTGPSMNVHKDNQRHHGGCNTVKMSHFDICQ